MLDRNIVAEAQRLLRKYVQDFLESGADPRAAILDSPRVFRGYNPPAGQVIDYLTERGYVRIDFWKPEFEIGDRWGSYVIIPTVYGIKTVDDLGFEL